VPNTLKCNYLTPLDLKGLTAGSYKRVSKVTHLFAVFVPTKR